MNGRQITAWMCYLSLVVALFGVGGALKRRTLHLHQTI